MCCERECICFVFFCPLSFAYSDAPRTYLESAGRPDGWNEEAGGRRRRLRNFQNWIVIHSNRFLFCLEGPLSGPAAAAVSLKRYIASLSFSFQSARSKKITRWEWIVCVYNLGDDDDRLFCLLFPKGIFSSSLPAEELSSQLHAHILILSHDDGSHFFSFYLSLSLFHRSIYLHLPFSRYISISSSSQLKVRARQRTVINLLGVREKPAGPPGHSNPGEATWRARQRQRGGSYTRASLLSMAANDVWCVLMKWPQCSWWSRIRDMGKSFWSESELYSQPDWLR